MEKILLKNSIWIVLSQATAKLASFFYTLYLARSLGVSDFGLYITALTYFAIISAISDFGVARYLIREISIHEQKVSKLISTTIFLRLVFLSIFFSLFVFIISSFDADIARRNLAILAVAAVLPQSVALTIDALFIALLKINYSSFAMLVSNLLSMTIGVVLVSLGYSNYGALIAMLIGQVLYICILIIMTMIKKMKWLDIVDEQEIRDIIIGAIPYGILSIIGVISFRADILILSYYKGNYETGIYGMAYKFIDGIIFIPSALATAYYPLLVRLHEIDINKIKKVYFKSLIIMALLGTGVSLCYILLLPIVLTKFFHSYLSSIPLISILSFSVPFIFMHIPSGQILLSTEKYLKNTLIMYVSLLIMNMFLYFITIPIYGSTGAASVSVISEVSTFVVFFYYIRHKILSK